MRVVVDQTGNHRAAFEIDDARCRLCALTDGGEPAASDHHGVHYTTRVVERVNPAVDESEVPIIDRPILWQAYGYGSAEQCSADEVAPRQHGASFASHAPC